MSIQVWTGILLPFLGTSLGAAMVFVLKDQISDNVQKILTGFAAGVMVAASFCRDTCLAAQDRFKKYLDYYGVKY